MANNFAQVVTPKGVAVYPKLRTTEVFEGEDTGKYVCGIKLSKEDTEKLIARIENEWEMAKKTSEFEGKRYGRNAMPSLGFHEDKQGDIVFKAKTNAVIRTKAGEVIEKSVPVFDIYGKPYDIETEVGNGSTIKLCMLLRPFYASGTIFGIQLLLKAVQVIEYVAPSMGNVSASDCGFECATEENTDDLPFTDDSATDF